MLVPPDCWGKGCWYCQVWHCQTVETRDARLLRQGQTVETRDADTCRTVETRDVGTCRTVEARDAVVWCCSLPYAAVQRVTNDGSSLLMEVTSDEGVISRQHLKLASRLLASALYRAMTENYYFYQCDTVGRAVMLQSSRDFKGTLASLFNENTEMGSF